MSSDDQAPKVVSYTTCAGLWDNDVRKPGDVAQFADAIHQPQMYWLVLNEQPTVS